jgi:hypothetical protein
VGYRAELVARSIDEGMKEVPETEAVMVDVKGLASDRIIGFDIVMLGVIDGCFGPTGDTKTFIDGISKTGVKEQSTVVFDTYVKKEFGTLRKIEKRISDKAPGLKLVTPGLSIRVDGPNGPIATDELSKCREFGRKLASELRAGNEVAK